MEIKKQVLHFRRKYYGWKWCGP